MRLAVLLATTVLATTGLAACAHPKAPPPNSAAAQTAPVFVMMAGASDLYEIQSSQAVLDTTRNPDIRRFAQMMVEHHTMTTQQVMDAARKDGLSPPPPVLDAKRAAMLSDLKGASGSARDRLYVQQQVMAHQEALTLHTNYSQNGDKPNLRTAATGAVPIVQRHLTEVQGMQSRMP